MDQVLPFVFAVISTLVVWRIAFDPSCFEQDRHVRNSDLRRPAA